MKTALSLLSFVAAALWCTIALADDVAGPDVLTARQIMQFVDERDDGDHGSQDMEMILIDKRGNRRERTIRALARDVGEDEQSIMFFLAPADVKDTGFLTYDYDDPESGDDQWLYLPALKKTKRIASNDKSGSFMGSDFSYADMTDRDLDLYDYTLMQETEVNGAMVWQIEAIPNDEKEIDETGYTKSVLFVRQDNFVVVRAVYWVKKGKRLKYLDVKNPLPWTDANIREGGILYMQNCAMCHGDALDGKGIFARAWQPGPANFRDSGTIGTVDENYVFWRIKEGGPGVPKGSIEYRSSMPVWDGVLSDDEIWKIIMFEYTNAGVKPAKRAME